MVSLLHYCIDVVGWHAACSAWLLVLRIEHTCFSVACRYVQQVLGQGIDKEHFYDNPQVQAAFKNYLTMLMNRVNTITGKRAMPICSTVKDCNVKTNRPSHDN